MRTLQGHSETVMGLDLAIGEVDQKPQLIVASASEDKSCRVFVVALWTAGVEVTPSGVTPAGYGAFGGAGMPSASYSRPSPALQATGVGLEAPQEPPQKVATPSASPGDAPEQGCPSPSSMPV
ncbi:unnamed protein product [Durusdinium trenchii]|uniref:Uncharacterized protein n=1 Tax=Durusdinium trenchii TaxID=1381693 RepID=A0ABP0P2M2_9DINO